MDYKKFNAHCFQYEFRGNVDLVPFRNLQDSTLHSLTFPSELREDGLKWKLELASPQVLGLKSSVKLRLYCAEMREEYDSVVRYKLILTDGVLEEASASAGWFYPTVGKEVRMVEIKTNDNKRRNDAYDVYFTCTITVFKLRNGIFDSLRSGASEAYFKDLWGNPQHADAVIEADGREFPVHMSILASRSTVFESMFGPQTKESRTGRIIIPDAKAEAVKEFLGYVYTKESPPGLKKWARELFILGDRYAVEGLKNLSETELIGSLALDNCLDLLVLSHLHNSTERLKREAMEFVITQFLEIVKTDQWQDVRIKNGILIDEVMCLMRMKIK